MTYSPDDEPKYEEATRAGIAGLEAYRARLVALAERTVRVDSTDRQVTVTVTWGGRVTGVRIHPGALRGYSSTRLGDVVTRTVRTAQERARAEYEGEARRLMPAEPPSID